MAERYVFEVVVGGFASAEEACEQLTGVLLDYDYDANQFVGSSLSYPAFVRTQPEIDESQED